MSETVWIACPHCGGRLKLKNRNVVGKKVPCPKCSVPFRIEVPPESEAELEVFEDDFESFDRDDEYPSNEAMPVDDDEVEEFDDEYESRPRRAAATGKTRGKKSAESNGLLIAAAVGGGALFVIALGVGVYFVTRPVPLDRPDQVIIADAEPTEAAEQPAADDSAGEEPAAAQPTFAGDAEPAAETEPGTELAQATPQGNTAQKVPSGEAQLSEEQLAAIREKMRKNKGAFKAAMKQRREKVQHESKWTRDDVLRHEAQKELPPDQRTKQFDVDEKVHREVASADEADVAQVPAGAAPPEEGAPSQPMSQQPAEGTTNQAPANAAQTTNQTTAPTPNEPAVDPEDAAKAAIKDLGGKAMPGADRTVEAVTLANIEDLTDDDLAHLEAFTNLQRLDLGYSPITDEGLSYLVGLTQLTGLNLSGTKITNDGLEHLTGLTNLKHLALRDTDVSSRGIEHLVQLQSLEQLFYGGSKIKGTGLKKLGDALPQCKIER